MSSRRVDGIIEYINWLDMIINIFYIYYDYGLRFH